VYNKSRFTLSHGELATHELYKNQLKIYLGKVTLFYGDNASGKTYCGELIYSTITGEPLQNFYEKQHDVEIEIDSINAPLSISIYKDQIKYETQGIKSDFNILKTEVVYLRKEFKYGKDQIKSIAECFGVKDYIIQRLLVTANFQNSPWISDIKVKTKRYKPYIVRTIYFKTRKNGVDSEYFVNLGNCSGAELRLLIVEIGIILSRILSMRSPTLYIIDSFILNILDDEYSQQIINELQSINSPFQSIFISPYKNNIMTWTGWEIARFHKTCPNTEIIQDIL